MTESRSSPTVIDHRVSGEYIYLVIDISGTYWVQKYVTWDESLVLVTSEVWTNARNAIARAETLWLKEIGQ